MSSCDEHTPQGTRDRSVAPAQPADMIFDQIFDLPAEPSFLLL